jgi:sec-independent protein translocase protein TatA
LTLGRAVFERKHMTMNELPLAFLQNIGTLEWVVIFIFALLLFGKRLPEVARNLGKSFVEFKRGLQNVQDDLHTAAGTDKPQDPKPGA